MIIYELTYGRNELTLEEVLSGQDDMLILTLSDGDTVSMSLSVEDASALGRALLDWAEEV